MFNEIQKTLAEMLNIDENKITPKSHIKNDLGADSLDILQLLMEIEEKYGIKIPDDELKNFSTVEKVVELIESSEKVAM